MEINIALKNKTKYNSIIHCINKGLTLVLVQGKSTCTKSFSSRLHQRYISSKKISDELQFHNLCVSQLDARELILFGRTS